ncbi:SDR family NAD(P)-dependent oxidoreductase [uncultured Cohaesibacter sp.]|uniref:SDR family NAD(P)-dependent oxidoreductase n=1 Tax=uncultured Cohaesibacter sp. TaxID=1002546 RepID=UPI0029C6A914|nr:SDR family NAD(P)-dependent oxidoreductase [uncultured Cohaesibacter sp.]
MSDNWVEVIGRACRLPGANSISEFWNLLVSEKCSVGEIGADRFSTFRYLHPKSGQAGKTYTFRAGVLDDVWGFDPSVFSLSPREATQMDPQQRLLLMLVWEALEEAGLPISEVAGSNIGVFVGNSGSDHSNRFFFDPASSDSFMMTGNTLSLVSNRISYVYDLHGPSFTVDTACSSSLVALDLALKRLQSGEIDTAIVAGVNLLLSPFPFVGFSAASMLSPQGLCRPFDENANGYVRAEGAVALVLQRKDAFDPAIQKSFGRIVASGINSDGRTSGVALPSMEFQSALLGQLYTETGLSPDALAFIEAHGTGTRVGDPAEAFALGQVLGQKRQKPLPIGSVKSNLGHLEPASGLVSVLKALLSLEHDLLPASLHIDSPNPDIPFDELNLTLNSHATALEPSEEVRYAGINNFGFGGTNAHVVVSDTKANRRPQSRQTPSASSGSQTSLTEAQEAPSLFVLTARTEEALKALAARSAQAIASEAASSLKDWCNAVGWHRSLLDERLAVICRDKKDLCAALEAFASENKSPALIHSSASRASRPPVFVYSGNGSQFAGMGLEAYRQNGHFAESFDQVDSIFTPLSGWSLKEKLFEDTLKEDLKQTSIAQPLLFAIQVALTEALKASGIQPGAVMGHSVGEVAAAWASGALSLQQAVEVIYWRSHHQEAVAGTGKMAVIKLSEAETTSLLEQERFAGIEISAINTDKSLTLSGASAELEAFLKLARKRRLAAKMLDINYPFHSAEVEPIKKGLIADLASIKPTKAILPFYSAVTGSCLEGNEMDGDYWWQNVRQPVRFLSAVEAAFADEQTQFLEIGPRAILKSYIGETARDRTKTVVAIESLTQKTPREMDPVLIAASRAIANGLSFDKAVIFGEKQACSVPLPSYPWQLKPFKITPSSEAFDIFNDKVIPHALLGQQIRNEEHVWSTELDTAQIPYLDNHKVDGKVILPGAAFAEMALAAAQIAFGTDRVELRDMDLLQALPLSDEQSASLLTRLDTTSGVVEISSRTRLVDEEWQLHAKCRVAKIPGDVGDEFADHALDAPALTLTSSAEEIDALYAISREFGLDFGPAFQRLTYCQRHGDDFIEIVIADRDGFTSKREELAAPYALHPLDFDACFHGLNSLYESLETGAEKMAFIPVRFGRLRILQSGTAVRSARIHVIRSNSRGIKADINMFAEDGSLVATLRDGRFRASALVQRQGLDRLSYYYDSLKLALPGSDTQPKPLDGVALLETLASLELPERSAIDDGQMLLHAASRRGAYDILHQFADANLRLDETSLPKLTARQDLDGENADEDIRSRSIHRKQIFGSLIAICEQSGLVKATDEGWELASESGLPETAQILQMLMSDNPRWSAECVMLNHALKQMPDLIRSMDYASGDQPMPQDLYSNDLFEQHLSSSPLYETHVEQISAALERILEQWPEGRPLRILEFGIAGARLTKAILPLLEEKKGILVAADTNKLIIDRLRILFANSIHFEAVALKSDLEALEPHGPFDLVISANGIQLMDQASTMLEPLTDLLASDGIMLMSLSDVSVFQDLVFAPSENWFDDSVDPSLPLSCYGAAEDWRGWIKEAGFGDVKLSHFANGAGETDLSGAYLLTATGKPATATAGESDIPLLDADHRRIYLLQAGESEQNAALLAALEHQFKSAELNKLAIDTTDALGQAASLIAKGPHDGALDVIYAAGSAGADALNKQASSFERLSASLHQLADLIRSTADIAMRLWIIAPGGYPDKAGEPCDPVQSALWAFGRTVSNEYENHDVRLVDFAQDLSPADRSSRLARLIETPGEEREILLNSGSQNVVRVRRGWPQGTNGKASHAPDAGCQLYHPRTGSFDRLQWIPVKRRKPAKGEVEIEVVASGLNFRDVMWAQGLLPEEALEDGFAGPTLGFECSGRITALGQGVKGLKIGDPVMTLAPASFASHVTVMDSAISKLPETIDLTAAATMPVAFLTAYYALHHLARLEEGEWVLIHGAAGAVGLAAVQIAKWRGARIIATAGNEEKRNFLKMLGADHVLNTRSLNFVDQVRSITRQADGPDHEGVDVVLNSLFGEAMERSLELVRPFGRFLELGKRDFYGNTQIGLRPFRRNISYFGIDADQLLNKQPARAKRLFAELAELIGNEQFTALPYRLFESSDIVDAFRLMQRSGHIGKIVVKAPEPISSAGDENGFKTSEEGHHVLIGGLGGFGLEVARWLASKGARSIILTSRSGKMSDEALALKQALANKGCALMVKPCDVSNETALKTLLEDLRKDRPISGVMHMAAVLDDVLLANMSDEQIDKVLGPKVIGSDNLDRATRQDDLDYFWLFSSVSVLIGNPGQANYVAANSYMDGLARKRRQEGLPALAVGWGAITDVGILARDKQTAEILARTTGGIEFKAKQALDQLSRLLEQLPSGTTPAAITLAPMNWGYASDNLPIMKSPTYTLLQREAAQSSRHGQQALDVANLIEGLDDVAARGEIAKILAQEVAGIFRMPVEEINLKRSLTDLGMDSLMGMELRTAAQQKLDIEIPMGAIADGTTIEDIAARVLERIRGEAESGLSFTEETLLHQHIGSDSDASSVASQLAEVRKSDI